MNKISILCLVLDGKVHQLFLDKEDFQEKYARGQCESILRGAKLVQLSGMPVEISTNEVLFGDAVRNVKI